MAARALKLVEPEQGTFTAAQVLAWAKEGASRHVTGLVTPAIAKGEPLNAALVCTAKEPFPKVDRLKL